MAELHPLRVKKLLREELGLSNVKLVKDGGGKEVIEICSEPHPIFGIYAVVGLLNPRRKGRYRVYKDTIVTGDNVGKHVVKLPDP